MPPPTMLYIGCLLGQSVMDGFLRKNGLQIKKALFWMMFPKLVSLSKKELKAIIVQIVE